MTLGWRGICFIENTKLGPNIFVSPLDIFEIVQQFVIFKLGNDLCLYVKNNGDCKVLQWAGAFAQ